jgi:hypothetical protein
MEKTMPGAARKRQERAERWRIAKKGYTTDMNLSTDSEMVTYMDITREVYNERYLFIYKET